MAGAEAIQEAAVKVKDRIGDKLGVEQKVWAVLPSLWVNWGSRCLGICGKSKSVFFSPSGAAKANLRGDDGCRCS